MSPADLDLIIQALHTWADKHPYKDEPSLTIGMRSYTPKELVKQVDLRTPVGLLHLRVLDHAIQSKAETLETILEGLNPDRLRKG